MLEGYPAGRDDLAEDAFVLVAARLPKRQRCADAASAALYHPREGSIGVEATFTLGLALREAMDRYRIGDSRGSSAGMRETFDQLDSLLATEGSHRPSLTRG